jgi:hypothetical protein
MFERDEIAAGLERVPTSAEPESDPDVASRERAYLWHQSLDQHHAPESDRGDGEPGGQQRARGRAVVEGELSEDRHRSESRGG